jgi:hypothetical protein
MKINRTGLDKELGRQMGPILRREGRRRLMKVINDVHQKLMTEFETHPVTQEIEAGPGSSNISGTLNGYGDLFSYIGFDSGDNPIMAVRVILEKSLYLRHIPSGAKDAIQNFMISLPSMAQIEAETPMPWATGRSWVKGIEQGISGFGKYLTRQSPASRSGGAIQTEKSMRGGGFRNTQYLSAILNGLEGHIRKALKQ